MEGGGAARIAGSGCVALMVAIAALGAAWTPFDPFAIELSQRLAPPSVAHWLGTDEFGRDVLSRMMVAAGVSLLVALGTTAGALLAGVALGALAAYFRGWLERTVIVFSDALMAFPGLLLALGIMAALGPQRWGVVAALALAYTPKVVRITRAVTLSLAAREFVLASRALGNGELRTIARHVVPNCITPLTIVGTTIFGAALLSETALSFLGLGVPPPESSWGGMMADGRQYLSQAPVLIVAPGLAVSFTLLGVNLLGDALRDRLDPRMARL